MGHAGDGNETHTLLDRAIEPQACLLLNLECPVRRMTQSTKKLMAESKIFPNSNGEGAR